MINLCEHLFIYIYNITYSIVDDLVDAVLCTEVFTTHKLLYVGEKKKNINKFLCNIIEIFFLSFFL